MATVSELPTEATARDPPAAKPLEYTMQDVLGAIPRHCYQSNTRKSLQLVARDVVMALTLFAIATFIPNVPNTQLRVLAWTIYSFAQGLVFTGMWEMAHESGHGALSPRKWVNDAIGLCLHSCLLVPYYSWQFTHRTHHKGTNHLNRDIAFMPEIKAPSEGSDGSVEPDFWQRCHDLVEDCPATVLLTLIGHQLVAFPIYLILNNFALSRMRKVAWWKRSHFYLGGDGPNFRMEQTSAILISDLALLAVLTLLWTCVQRYGGWTVFLLYGLPYLWTNHWILTITFLQHTDISVPYYSNQSWSFLRGAAATIDRDFGFIGRFLFHGAIETHVLHHHACQIPCYHAAEASAAMRKVIGTSYHQDMQTPYLVAFWNNFRMSRTVGEREAGTYYY